MEAKWIAKHFADKYYDVLHKHPEFMHKFYKEQVSTLCITDGNNPSVTATDMKVQLHCILQWART